MKAAAPTEAAALEAWIAGAQAVFKIYQTYRAERADVTAEDLIEEADRKLQELRQ